LTTSEPNEQPPTNATPGPSDEPPKPARSRRAHAAAQPFPPSPPLEAPTTDGDETQPIAVEPVVAEAPALSAPAPVVVESPTHDENVVSDVYPRVEATRMAAETVYVPLAVSIGDGFKFGCGFFLALVMAMLVGFVLLALLFVLSSIVGLNLPITR
jgi:hypothetical protein